MELRIRAEKVGSVWVGCIDGHPDVAERALSKEAAEEKARRIAGMIERGEYNPLRRSVAVRNRPTALVASRAHLFGED